MIQFYDFRGTVVAPYNAIPDMTERNEHLNLLGFHTTEQYYIDTVTDEKVENTRFDATAAEDLYHNAIKSQSENKIIENANIIHEANMDDSIFTPTVKAELLAWRQRLKTWADDEKASGYQNDDLPAMPSTRR